MELFSGSDRYQELVEKLMISGLSAEETQEMERLGSQMDAESALFMMRRYSG